MAGKDSETLQRGIKLQLELSCGPRSGKPGDQTNTCLVISSLDHTRKPLNLTKRTTTPSGLMQPGTKRIGSRNKGSSPHAKGPNGILTKKRILNAPPNHQKIRVNLIFAVKYNGRHKARLVADGSLTPEPVENIYSGVVSLRHLRLVIFLGELSSTILKYGELILGMPIWRSTPMKDYSS